MDNGPTRLSLLKGKEKNASKIFLMSVQHHEDWRYTGALKIESQTMLDQSPIQSTDP